MFFSSELTWITIVVMKESMPSGWILILVRGLKTKTVHQMIRPRMTGQTNQL